MLNEESFLYNPETSFLDKSQYLKKKFHVDPKHNKEIIKNILKEQKEY